MKSQNRQRASAVVAALLAAAVALSAPAQADPPSGTTSSVDMQMPGPSPVDSPRQPSVPYAPPSASLSAQRGGAVDRDGTDGYVDSDGTNGTITGPLIRAVPVIPAS